MRNQDFNFDSGTLRAQLWQDNQGTVIPALLAAKAAWYERAQAGFWAAWTRRVFDLGGVLGDDLDEFGCAVWARILGITLTFTGTQDFANWGFGAEHENFTRGNFGSGEPVVIKPSLAEQRFLLRLRYFSLTSDGNVLAVNAALARIARPFGKAYMTPNPGGKEMTVQYSFAFQLSQAAQYALASQPILPTPGGMAQLIRYIDPFVIVSDNIAPSMTLGAGGVSAGPDNIAPSMQLGAITVVDTAYPDTIAPNIKIGAITTTNTLEVIAPSMTLGAITVVDTAYAETIRPSMTLGAITTTP